MKLINPKGREVEINDKKAKKILARPVKLKHGWKRKVKQNSLDNLKKSTPKKVVNKTAENKK